MNIRMYPWTPEVVRTAVAGLVLAGPLAAQTAPTRTLIEEFRIDGTEHELNVIRGVMPLRNGNVLVLQRGDWAGTIFSASGEMIKQIGRKGAGPGELQSLGWFGLFGDSIWMTDGNLGRLTMFGQDGSVGRMIPQGEMPDWEKVTPGVKGAFTRVTPRSILPGDIALGSPGAIASAITGGVIKQMPFIRMRWDGSDARVIAWVPVVLSAIEVRSGDRTTYVGSPFSQSARIETSRDGRQVVFIDAVETPRRAIRIIRLSASGDTIAKHDIPYVPVPIPQRVIDSTARALAIMIQMPTKEADVRRAFGDPKFYHPFQNILVANDGTVWIQPPVTNGERRWMVVSPSGRVTQHVVSPASVQLLWIDGSIWGVARDADDVPSVVRYRLGR